eukprot:TRINITY_DN33920_c0_g1_i1.p1 TRINITY_DN33920_c0_g1~~TRINITY_DN33920_c0_g1_i1.p1  ORF type:complete len:354 (-),score=68.96 TRINITY_DN33920_c0_g1_i1:76-1137(-)
MAKLFSHHDKYHVHAIFGFLALLHFAYRFYCVLIEQRESFTPSLFSAASLSVHVVLHALSFQFEVPRNRIWTKPMIWREFRIHNAVFALRHLVASAFGIWAPDWWWRQPDSSSVVAKLVLICTACKAADIATEKAGSLDDRTTNSMPYPKKTAKSVEAVAKKFYAKSQFAATALAAFGTPSLSFCSVLAIEIASFLMTLVRKGLIEARTYHAWYSLSLFVMFPCLVASIHSGHPDEEMAAYRAMTACFFSIPLRLDMRVSKYITWCVSIVAGFLIIEAGPHFVDMTRTPKVIAWLGMAWSAGDTVYSFACAERSQEASEEKVEMPEGKLAHEGKVSEKELSTQQPPYVMPNLG